MSHAEGAPESAAGVLEMSLSSTTELASVRARIREWLSARSPSDATDEVILALGEALDNALEHGGTPVRIVLEWSTGSVLVAWIKDSGEWRSVGNPRQGFGIRIMRALMDSLTVHNNGGTVVRLARRFES